jgi:predicted negative regulator of RcsB-dependent stress response
MKNLLIFVVVLVVAVGALGYWRGWFSVSNQGVQTDAEKFNKDKDAFSKSAGEKAAALKEQVAKLWSKTEGLKDDDKAHAQKELAELKMKHERLEKQLKELDDAGQDRFDSIRQDITRALEEVDQKIAELTRKMENRKEK